MRLALLGIMSNQFAEFRLIDCQIYCQYSLAQLVLAASAAIALLVIFYFSLGWFLFVKKLIQALMFL